MALIKAPKKVIASRASDAAISKRLILKQKITSHRY
jgi:hypothetical protein